MSLVYPVLIVIATWWIGTGVVLYLQQRMQLTRTPLILTLILISLASLVVLRLTSNGFSHWQTYSGFIAAVVLWGCIELSYYTGLVTGIHKRPCPARCDNTRRFLLALGTSIWHELSVLVTAMVVMWICWQGDNPAGLYSFMVLWLMRWSAKLNLFLGVPNFNADWFPEHLAYAHTYMKRSSVSPLFPLSILLSSAVAVHWMMSAVSAPPAQALATALPCVLLMLAILEHLFMALPIADSALWNRVFAQDEVVSESLPESPSLVEKSTRSNRSMTPMLTGTAPEIVSVTIGCVDPAAPKTLA